MRTLRLPRGRRRGARAGPHGEGPGVGGPGHPEAAGWLTEEENRSDYRQIVFFDASGTVLLQALQQDCASGRRGVLG